MKRILVFLLLLSLPAVFTAADPLWDRAVDYYTRGQDYHPGNMILQSSELDGHGKVREFWEMEYRLTRNSLGEETQELLWARHDGEPAEQEELDKRDSSREESRIDTGYFQGISVLPLDISARGDVEAVYTGTREWLEGQDCLIYRISQVYSGGAESIGKAWINQEGFPVRLDLEFVNLPFYMKEMKNSIVFTRINQAAVPEELNMQGFVSIVVYKFRFISNIFFRNYQLP